jgi:hypothetical protein
MVALMIVWSTGALYYSPLLNQSFRPGAAAIFVIATTLAVYFFSSAWPDVPGVFGSLWWRRSSSPAGCRFLSLGPS